MPILVNLPDGSQASFPDGTPPDAMKAAIQKNFPPQQPQSIGDQLSAGFTSGINALPIVGPTVLQGLERAKGFVQGRPYEDVTASDKAQVEQNPIASTTGTVAGTVLPFVLGGEIPAAAKVLGLDSSVPLLGRTLASLGSSAAISGADTLARGGSLQDAGKDAAVSGTIGAFLPGAGDIVGSLAGQAGKQLGRVWDTVNNTDRAASKVVGRAAEMDTAAGKAVTPTDEATAAANGQPLINADRFGSNVRTLARTAANTDPAAEGALKSATQDRFLTQNARAVDFVKGIAGGGVDDVALRDMIQTAAQGANKTAYARAYADPAAKVVWTPEIKQLFQSPDFISAVKGAERRGANDAALGGFKAVKSPFAFDAAGNISIRVNPDGSKALPSLPFWDMVQRNLRSASDKAFTSGDKSLGSELTQMRGKLLGSLDQAVPSFNAARRGAAAAFGAEDALDAGRKFVSQRMGIPEARKAYTALSPAERKAFGVGFASELIDKIGSVSDRVNVINQMFGSPAARAQVELALGPGAASKLEAFTRIEDIMQQTNHAVSGNSTTAKQLLAAGAIGGGAGFVAGGHNPLSPSSWEAAAMGATLLAAGRAGAKVLTKNVDQKVMMRVAQILSSQDPAELSKAVKVAAGSPAWRAALQAIQTGLRGAGKGLGAIAARQSIPVSGGPVPIAAPAP